MKIISVLLLLMFYGCGQSTSKNETTRKQPSTIKTNIDCNYATRQLQCKKLYATKHNRPGKLIQYITDSLIGCWYGTGWDFNGCTTTPLKGNIACGYFVTTILQHSGLPINRIKMAQCPSSKLIRTTCTGISTFSNKSIGYCMEAIKKQGYGLYIAGLDCHTGFIYNDGIEIYFIHASYYGPKCVVKEKAMESAVLQNSKFRIIGRVHFGQ